MAGRRPRLWLIVGAVVVASVLGILAGFLWIKASEPVGDSARIAGAQGLSRIGGPFALIDQNGTPRTDADFRGRYMLIFFGYTHCPDVCPTELQTISDARDALGSEADKIVPIFITVDPERDDAKTLKAYVGNFHPRLIGLTGSLDAIEKVTKAYRVYRAKAGDGDDYLMDHSAFTYLMGPDGRYVAHFRYGIAPKAMARTLRTALRAPNS